MSEHAAERGIRLARLVACGVCASRRFKLGDRWPTCAAGGGELSSEHLRGGACPLGRWEGLSPVALPGPSGRASAMRRLLGCEDADALAEALRAIAAEAGDAAGDAGEAALSGKSAAQSALVEAVRLGLDEGAAKAAARELWPEDA